MIIYGVAVLAGCLLAGMIVGDLLGALLGVEAMTAGCRALQNSPRPTASPSASISSRSGFRREWNIDMPMYGSLLFYGSAELDLEVERRQ